MIIEFVIELLFLRELLRVKSIFVIFMFFKYWGSRSYILGFEGVSWLGYVF